MLLWEPRGLQRDVALPCKESVMKKSKKSRWSPKVVSYEDRQEKVWVQTNLSHSALPDEVYRMTVRAEGASLDDLAQNVVTVTTYAKQSRRKPDDVPD
jgi:hypothetical protein